MIADILLVAGVLVLAFALRSFAHPVLFRLGGLCLLAASFLAGWLISGSIALGIVCAAVWLFLPWVEILARFRPLRLPIERELTSQTPPSRALFPGFEELSGEIEAEGFFHVADVGWTDEGSRQFYRVFRNEQSRAQASICLAEQDDMAFFYLTLTSRVPGGRVFVSWNYPFPYGLKFSPTICLNRQRPGTRFADLARAHADFLRGEGIAAGAIQALSDEEVLEAMRRDQRVHVRHNLDVGLLARDGEHWIRYTYRGMFFLWVQALRDAIRFF